MKRFLSLWYKLTFVPNSKEELHIIDHQITNIRKKNIWYDKIWYNDRIRYKDDRIKTR